jgi:predicted TIM-barrel fold metal-dependent hydrolase
MKIKYYDCHCHVFNKDLIDFHLLVHIFLSLPDILKKTEEHADRDKKQTIGNKINSRVLKLKRIMHFLEAGFSKTDYDVYAKMKKVYGEEYAIAPLMFDLEYCFIGKRSASVSHLSRNFRSVNEIFEPSVDEFLVRKQNFINNAPDEISVLLKKERNHRMAELKEMEALHNRVKEKLTYLKDNHLNNFEFTAKLSSSYKKQLQDMIALKENFPSTIFPFIAIDPRREGIIDAFIHEIYPQQVFTGVKLYTPLGYSPTDYDLIKKGGLYDFCEKHQIPITAHHSNVGFATPLQDVEIFGDVYENGQLIPQQGFIKFSKAFSNGWVQERAEKLNHPMLWLKVLNAYPNLKLNLAHFGAGSNEWQNEVFDMMHTYKNLYSDFSRYTSLADLIFMKETYFDKASPLVKAKFLYGSDFYFDLLYVDSLNDYINNFLKVFNYHDFTAIAQKNAMNFLNINGHE